MTDLVGRRVHDLDTPRLVVDADLLAHNIDTLHGAVLPHAAVRSHVKTHKSVDIARMQIEAGAVGIAAAKVSEAAVFVAAGVKDVVVAYPVFGVAKWQRLAALAADCDRLAVHVENEQAVRGLSEAAAGAGVTVGLRIEIDSGFRRTGVDAEGAIALARLISDAPGCQLDAITSHRSMFFPGAGGRDPYELGIEEGGFMVDVAHQIRSAGFEVPRVVAGSTPTAIGLATVEGIDEVCAGTYAFYDAGMADHGVVERSSVALSIPATVVVAHAGTGRYTVDAGAKTFTKDRYPGDDVPVFGRAVERADAVIAVTDEHGIVSTDAPLPDLGEVVSFHPMHVCPVVNLADELVVARGGVVEDVWPVSARGMNR